MSWFKKALSIFSWHSEEEPESKSAQFSAQKKKDSYTVGEVKQWISQELPPLAWQRAVLRVSKFAMQNFQIDIRKASDDLVLPENLFLQINIILQELYNKKIQ